ncbi:hypothetical protein BVRB_8g181460 [Beta vulgaris subsp. vulgaris]|nr:hypothetical protein BVRB_8g181460 [Beta vulgaris subsp. vulgaris]
MNLLKPPSKYFYNTNNYHHLHSFHSNSKLTLGIINKSIRFYKSPKETKTVKKLPAIRACATNEEAAKDEDRILERKTFLSIEEAGLVEISGLSIHERFLCRLTISSLNLLRVIAEQEACTIEELNAGRICDWFLKDKLKREQNIGSAVLQWDDDDPFQGQF